jgi:epoxyqueuosine reductase
VDIAKKSRQLYEKTHRFASRAGADFFGAADAQTLLAKAPSGFRPEDILPGSRAVVVVGKRLSDATVETTPSRMFDGMYFSVNAFINQLNLRMVDFFTRLGFRAVAIGPSSQDGKLLRGDISQKHAAVAAGLGRFGLQSLVLTPQAGPRQRWGAIVTDAPLETGAPRKEGLCRPEECGQACIHACPAKVFSLPDTKRVCDPDLLPGGLWYYWDIDKRACMAHRNRQKEELGWITEGPHACAVCLKVCPVGARV